MPVSLPDQQGLSPRVRGNHGGAPDDEFRRGSIPACAGEPPGSCGNGWPMQVYPRVCGGTTKPFFMQRTLAGLSPRVRGNLDPRGWWCEPVGSIPACAGEPQGYTSRKGGQQVYPRVCGGTDGVFPIFVERKGLSPRVRGNRKPASTSKGWKGSIPACAGEPAAPPVRVPGRRVYPRVCGGTLAKGSGQKHVGGLSPRVRGNPIAISETART